ncbi:MAG: hypothetical protein IKH56_04245 [Oscillospiraceae bacterium]|nr:hypothetical protein [Oscillospiraceae bacterium]
MCRFIIADGYASTGQGLLGGNAFAYCLNNPVKFYDNSGTLANWFVGAIVGGIIGGISSAIKGESFLAGALQGAVSGAIAGAAVDLAVACVTTFGVAGVVAGGAIAFVGGFAGNIAGEETYSLVTTREFTAVDSGMIKRSLVSGAINTVSFGLSATAKCADEGIKLGRASSASTSTAIKQTVKTAIKETFKPRYMDVFSTFSTVHFAVHATLINRVI